MLLLLFLIHYIWLLSLRVCSHLLFCSFGSFVPDQKGNDTFGPGLLSVHTGIFDSEPKDTEPKDTKPKGIEILSQPDWSGWMIYFVTELTEHSKQEEKVRST